MVREEHIQEEVVFRDRLQEIVEAALDNLYTFGEGRVGRGTVHLAISERLGLVHNNPLSQVIKAALAAKGAVAVSSRGYQYYRGLRERV